MKIFWRKWKKYEEIKRKIENRKKIRKQVEHVGIFEQIFNQRASG